MPEAAPRPNTFDALTPAAARELLCRLADNVERALRGKRAVVELALAAVVARGHLLVEDVPGVGKTTLAQALARSLELSFSRIQFTSDLLPSDIVGAQVFDARSATFAFRPGPVFAQVVLADELNRAPPRTQSALLEAMSDAQVSLDGQTHPLPRPFLVLATQNPREQSGTYPLPDSQLDRFMLRLCLGHPDAAVEQDILLSRASDEPVRTLRPLASAAEVLRLQATADAVQVDPALAGYVVALVRATRQSAELAGGASTRGALNLLAAARACALFDGRAHLLPDDVKRVAVACLAHRVVPSGRDASEADRGEAERILADLLERVPVPE
ncbi:MAG: AAA family ATPase [Deltaproteobacteria bacterium]|nr:AAA family ATPase [Deltaproteobacteria bacterium]